MADTVSLDNKLSAPLSIDPAHRDKIRKRCDRLYERTRARGIGYASPSHATPCLIPHGRVTFSPIDPTLQPAPLLYIPSINRPSFSYRIPFGAIVSRARYFNRCPLDDPRSSLGRVSVLTVLNPTEEGLQGASPITGPCQ